MNERPPRTLPYSRDAEEAIIGGILFSGRAIVEVGALICAQDFYDGRHEAIYGAMVELDKRSAPVDLVTVGEEMRRAGTMSKLSAVGNEAYLCDLANRIASVENIGQHARIVRDHSMARQLILAGDQIMQQGYSRRLNVEDYLDQAQQAVFAVQNRSSQETAKPLSAVLHKSIQSLEKRFHRKQAVTGVPSGYGEFDEMTAGLQPGDFVVVAGRPSMGKSAFVLNCCQNAGLLHNIPAMFFSLEMSDESLGDRLLCAEARVESQKFRTGFLEAREWINLTKAAQRLARVPMTIDEAPAALMDIRAKSRRWRADRAIFPGGLDDLGLVVIDYLQLIRDSGVGSQDDRRERTISDISRGLKALAKELRVPVVALAQLNRKVEERADKRPIMSDLRESGAIEQDADLICFLYRDDVYNKNSTEAGTAEVIIGKQRSGPTGMVRLAFLKEYTRFENLSARAAA